MLGLLRACPRRVPFDNHCDLINPVLGRCLHVNSAIILYSQFLALYFRPCGTLGNDLAFRMSFVRHILTLNSISIEHMGHCSRSLTTSRNLSRFDKHRADHHMARQIWGVKLMIQRDPRESYMPRRGMAPTS